MTQREFNKLTFSQRIEISKDTICSASWQVRTVEGHLYAISCRECGTVLQSNCTPKCLLRHPSPSEFVNKEVKKVSESDLKKALKEVNDKNKARRKEDELHTNEILRSGFTIIKPPKQ